MNIEVVCSAVGTGWARVTPTGGMERHPESADIAALSRVVADSLRHGRPVALGFATPLWMPVPTNELALGRPRPGDGGLAPGLASMAWVLRAIHERAPRVEYHADWHVFRGAGRGLFIWEAAGEPDEAALAFAAALPDPTRHNTLAVARRFSLAGAAALWAGMTDDLRVLAGPGLAIAA